MRGFTGRFGILIFCWCVCWHAPVAQVLLFKKKKDLTHEDSVAIAEKKMEVLLRHARNSWQKNNQKDQLKLRNQILSRIDLVREPGNAYLALSRLYFLQGLYRKAELTLELAEKHEMIIRQADLYIRARCRHRRSFYQLALQDYEAFIKEPGNVGKRYVEDAKIYAEQCKYALSIPSKQLRARLDTISQPFNTNFAESGPMISADGQHLYFIRFRDSLSSSGSRQKKKWYELVHFFNGKEEKMPLKLHELKLIPLTLSPDGRRMLLCGPGTEKDKDLYVSDWLDGKFGQPYRLPPDVNTKYNEVWASFGPDNRTLFFISDRPGGQGGLDIWISRQNESGWWSAPVNAGPEVNSTRNEYTVFMHADGKTLYFSSDGHASIGEADMLMTVFSMGRFSKPMNLGMPVNTPYPDYYFSITGSGRKAYMVSAPDEETGSTDLRILHLLGSEKQPVIFSSVQPSAMIPKREHVLITNDETCIECSEVLILNCRIQALGALYMGAQVQVYDHDLGTPVYAATLGSADSTITFVLPAGKKYALALLADGFFPFTEIIDIPAGSPYRLREKTIRLKFLQAGHIEAFHLIHFVPGTSTPTLGSIAGLEVLARFLTDHPEYRLHVFSGTHSDEALGKARKSVVLNFLLSQGIPGGKFEAAPESSRKIQDPVADIYIMISHLP